MPDPQLDIADFLVLSVVISVFAGLAAEYFIGSSIENRPTFETRVDFKGLVNDFVVCHNRLPLKKPLTI